MVMEKYWERRKLELYMGESIFEIVLIAKDLTEKYGMTIDQVNENINRELSICLALNGMGNAGEGQTIKIRGIPKKEEKAGQ